MTQKGYNLLVSAKTSKMLAVRRTDFNVKDHARTSTRFAAWSLNEMGMCLEEELYYFQAFCVDIEEVMQ